MQYFENNFIGNQINNSMVVEQGDFTVTGFVPMNIPIQAPISDFNCMFCWRDESEPEDTIYGIFAMLQFKCSQFCNLLTGNKPGSSYVGSSRGAADYTGFTKTPKFYNMNDYGLGTWHYIALQIPDTYTAW